MKNYYIRKILDDNQLDTIKKILKESNENNYWSDGLGSGGGTKSVKNNLELSNIDLCKIINDMIMISLDSDRKFINYVVAKSTNLNIISKTTSGGYYNPHLDEWMNGDYSTTVFLNNPDEYCGGELCLYFGGDEEVKIKLDAGWGVTYSTGTLHRVNRVISGTRYVSVFWTESLIKDQFIRSLYEELCNIEINIVDQKSSVHLIDCISASNDPCFSISNLKKQILRRYASK